MLVAAGAGRLFWVGNNAFGIYIYNVLSYNSRYARGGYRRTEHSLGLARPGRTLEVGPELLYVHHLEWDVPHTILCTWYSAVVHTVQAVWLHISSTHVRV